MKLKFSLKDIKENIAGMTRKEAVDYIWTYYKLPIVAAVCILFLVISLAGAMVGNALSDPVFTVGVVERVDLYSGEEISALAAEAFPGSTGYHAAQRMSLTSPASEGNPYGPVQLMSYLAAGDMDAIIGDQAIIDYILASEPSLQVTDISGTRLGKQAAEYGISPLLYLILPEDTKTDGVDGSMTAHQKAERFLEVLQKK